MTHTTHGFRKQWVMIFGIPIFREKNVSNISGEENAFCLGSQNASQGLGKAILELNN
jgi:hypothetical protein